MNDTLSATPAKDLKVTVTRDTWLGRKRLGTFTARLGDTGWKAHGTCKQGAIEQLYADLKNADENMFARKYVRKGNVTFALYYAGGWQYDIVRDDGKTSVTMMSLCNSFRDATERMLAHVAQHDGV